MYINIDNVMNMPSLKLQASSFKLLVFRTSSLRPQASIFKLQASSFRLQLFKLQVSSLSLPQASSFNNINIGINIDTSTAL